MYGKLLKQKEVIRMTDRQCLYISNEDVQTTEIIKMKKLIPFVEDVLANYGDGVSTNQYKVSQLFDNEKQTRINNMVATLFDENVCGMKWVSVFPDNPHLRGLLNAISVVLISDITNGKPKAFIDYSLCTALRTAAINGVAVKYLARKEAETVGIVGAGVQAITNFIAVKSVLDGIKVCKVSSRTKDSENRFISTLSKLYKDVAFIACNGNHEESVTDADIIITATSAQEPLIKAQYIKSGALYCHVAGYEDEFDVAKKADKIVCDNWEAVKHRKQTISQMYSLGILQDADIYGDIYEIINGEKKGRESEKEFIYFNSVGLAYLDVAISNEIFSELKDKDGIIQIPIEDKSILSESTLSNIIRS